MSAMARRLFLQNGLGLGGALLLSACGGGGGGQASSSAPNPTPTPTPTPSPTPTPTPAECPDSFAGGERLQDASFVGESTHPLEQAFGSGLDGRLFTDLSKLDPDHLVTSSEAFYIRTRYPDLLKPGARWPISIGGLPGPATDLFLDELLPRAVAQGTQLMECSGNTRTASFGLLSSGDWTGIPVLDAIDRFPIPAGATRLLVSGFDQYSHTSANSTPGAGWIFSFDDLKQAGAFLATGLDGAALPPDHGAPVRLVVPGWYGCTCIKWVNEIRFVGDDEPATSQMQEFASRTHQSGTPALARDYLPALIDLAAMPIRVEKWQVSGAIHYRVVGIQWGGAARTDELEIRFGQGAWQAICMNGVAQTPWALWEYDWQPAAAGTYAITLRATDPSIQTRRLDTGYYLREVQIDQV
jgi:DMSO/TMAO reductase YedYZ molybdopterin-dependent catalytic subunit